MAINKDINPGAFRAIKPVTLSKMAYRFLQEIKQMHFRRGFLYLKSNTQNYFNQRKKEKLYYCNCCDTLLTHFVNTSNNYSISYNSSCPVCSSRKRHRGLKFLYRDILKKYDNPMILHFAPEPVLMKVFEGEKVEYKTTDYFLDDVDYPKEDIQKLTFPNNSFDLVLCNHVIEHVPDDDSAMAEMARILKPGGMLLLTIPGNWHREHTHLFKDLSNNGHYRDYGMDIVTKLEKYYSKVEFRDLVDFNSVDGKSMGIERKNELAFICHK